MPPPAAAIEVSYTIGGSAVLVSDYTRLTGTVTVPESGLATVPVTVRDDTADEVEESIVLTLVDGTAYNLGTIKVSTVTITDDDPTTVTLAASAGAIPENGGTKAITVTLGRALLAGEIARADLLLVGATVDDFTLTGAAASGLAFTGLQTVSPGIVFTGPAAPTTATLTLTATQDNTDEGAGETVAVILGRLTPTGLDGGLKGAGGPVRFAITDDDTAGVVVSEESVSVAEMSGTAIFSVRLGSQPTRDVVVAVTSGDTMAATVSPSSLTFSPAAWNTPQTVTVTGVDDSTANAGGERDVAVTLNPSSSDPVYSGLDDATVAVSVADDEVGVPARLSAVPGNAEVALSWSAPAGGTTVTGYEVEYKTDAAADWTQQAHSGTTAEVTVTGLVNGTKYLFRVRVTSTGGSGDWLTSVETTPMSAYGDAKSGDRVHWWAFDESSGAVALDNGSRHAPGAINGATRVAEGRVGGSLEFGPGESGTYSILEPTGRNNFVSAGADPLAASGGWTAALWVKRTGDTSGSNLFSHARGGARNEVRLEMGRSNRVVGIRKSGTGYDFGYTVPKDQWTHLALVGGASATALYVNGVLQGTVSQSFDLPLATIGAGDKGWHYGVRGELDDIRVYDTGFSASEIKTLYDGYTTTSSLSLDPAVPAVAVEGGQPTAEGGDAVFTVTAAPPPVGDLVVALDVEETHGSGNTQISIQTTAEVTIPAGSPSASYKHTTHDDSEQRGGGAVVVVLRPSNDYTVSAEHSTAEVSIVDDDDDAVDAAEDADAAEEADAAEDAGGDDEDGGDADEDDEGYVVDAEVVARVRALAAQTHHGAAHVNRWERVLAAFGLLDGDAVSGGAMTAAEAEQMSRIHSSPTWPLVAAELAALEAARKEDEEQDL